MAEGRDAEDRAAAVMGPWSWVPPAAGQREGRWKWRLRPLCTSQDSVGCLCPAPVHLGAPAAEPGSLASA
jgi:hypothetical protein